MGLEGDFFYNINLDGSDHLFFNNSAACLNKHTTFYFAMPGHTVIPLVEKENFKKSPNLTT